MPEKYYVVQNNDMVRVKYILVYTSKDSPRRLLVCLVVSLSCALCHLFLIALMLLVGQQKLRLAWKKISAEIGKFFCYETQSNAGKS